MQDMEEELKENDAKNHCLSASRGEMIANDHSKPCHQDHSNTQKGIEMKLAECCSNGHADGDIERPSNCMDCCQSSETYQNSVIKLSNNMKLQSSIHQQSFDHDNVKFNRTVSKSEENSKETDALVQPVNSDLAHCFESLLISDQTAQDTTRHVSQDMLSKCSSSLASDVTKADVIESAEQDVMSSSIATTCDVMDNVAAARADGGCSIAGVTTHMPRGVNEDVKTRDLHSLISEPVTDLSDEFGVQYVKYESELQMPSIMQLITRDLSEPYSIYTYRYFIHNWPKLCFLAMDGQRCIGAIVCKLDIHKKVIRRGYIAMLAVDHEYRRKGIGSQLVRRAIHEMTCEGCDEVVLETEVSNKPALRLYENLGFVRDKRLFRYYLNGVDAFRLKLWFR